MRGFGFLHDGSVSTLFDFLHANAFAFPSQTDIDNMVAFLLAFDTGLAPAVGQQVTATPTTYTDASVIARLQLLLARADAGDCDLVGKGVAGAVPRGWLHVAATGPKLFRSDRKSEPLASELTLRNQAATTGQEVTFTCVPPGSGHRIGLDRDEDGAFDRDELDAGTDPAFSPTTTSTSTSTSTSMTPTTSTSTSTTIPTCSDGVENGSETDVDCGGGCCCPPFVPPLACAPTIPVECIQSSCKRCQAGQECLCGSDCASGECVLASGGKFEALIWRCALGPIPDEPRLFDPWWWLNGPVALVGDVVYVPTKMAFAALGGVASGFTYVVTLGDVDAARSVWRTSTGGDYLITPAMVAEGEAPRFFGEAAQPIESRKGR